MADKEGLGLYSADYPIYDTIKGKQLGVEYNKDGTKIKAGVENVYKELHPLMLPDEVKFQLGLGQVMGDFNAYGDLAFKSGEAPTGRVGVKYKPTDALSLDAQLYNYYGGREDLTEGTVAQLKAKYKLMDGLTLAAEVSANQDRIKDYAAKISYKKKF